MSQAPTHAPTRGCLGCSNTHSPPPPHSSEKWVLGVFKHPPLDQNVSFSCLLACQRGWWCTRIPLSSVWNHWPSNFDEGKKKVSKSPPVPRSETISRLVQHHSLDVKTRPLENRILGTPMPPPQLIWAPFSLAPSPPPTLFPQRWGMKCRVLHKFLSPLAHSGK